MKVRRGQLLLVALACLLGGDSGYAEEKRVQPTVNQPLKEWQADALVYAYAKAKIAKSYVDKLKDCRLHHDCDGKHKLDFSVRAHCEGKRKLFFNAHSASGLVCATGPNDGNAPTPKFSGIVTDVTQDKEGKYVTRTEKIVG